MWQDNVIEKGNKQFDFVVFIGRMEPGPHLGHIHVLKEAEKLADKVIILLGSRNRARSIKNPWRADEREIMIDLAINECIPELKDRYIVKGIADYSYNDQHWAQEVQKEVARITYDGFHGGAFHKALKIGIIGHRKDESSFYLDMFPQWKSINVSSMGKLNASDLRSLYFAKSISDFAYIAEKVLPKSVLKLLVTWSGNESYAALKEEYAFAKKLKESWQFSPYTPIFVTTDAVVIESGHILMIKRGAHPGMGQWALPGGYINPGESLRACCKRELLEETDIDVPPNMLNDLFKKAPTYVFDKPDRDVRGRFITHAFLVGLPTRSAGLSKIKGGDDASDARWIPLYEFDQMSENGEIYADHACIVHKMIGRI